MTDELLKKYEEEENYKELIKLIDKLILENSQKTSLLLYKKAKALIGLEKYEQAITTLNVFLKDCDEKDKFKAYITLSQCYSWLDDDENTVDALENALEYEPENELVLKQLSYITYINQDFVKCCEYIKKLIEIDKADIEDYTNLIFCCIQLDRIDEALKYAEKVIELDPTNLDVFATLTIVYESREDDEKLKEVCERIIDLKDDGTLQIILLKAQAYLEIGKKKEAFKFVDKAIKLNPYDPFPYLMKGILYNKLEMFDEANECFVEAFRLNPELLNMMDELS